MAVDSSNETVLTNRWTPVVPRASDLQLQVHVHLDASGFFCLANAKSGTLAMLQISSIVNEIAIE